MVKKPSISQNGSQVQRSVTISPPNIKEAVFTIVGTSPYVQNKFSNKAKAMMKAQQEAGSTAKKGKKRDAKDFKQCYEDAQYRPAKSKSPNGWIPATAIRAAMIAACRLVDFKMTEAKQCLYVVSEAFDEDERIPLIPITKGKPRYFEQALRNANGSADIRPRPMWEPGWESVIRIRYDADRFTLEDVTNLLLRAGRQVGIGDGRMASRMCVGLGWGAFEIKGSQGSGVLSRK